VAVIEMARSQHGVFTMADASAAGLSSRQVYKHVRTGEWSSPLPGVFGVSPTLDWVGLVKAATTWAGEQVAGSHTTAAFLWELEGIRPNVVDITTTGRKRSPREWLTIHQTIRPFPIQRRLGIPVTAVARTLIDLGLVVSPNALEVAVQDALRRRLTTTDRLAAELRQDGGRGARGAGRLARLLASVADAPTESELERRVLRILDGAGFPSPECQHTVEMPSGLKARIDFAYPAQKVGIEADGYRWHSSRTDWSRDKTRLNGLVALGWRILHITWTDIEAGGARLIDNLRTLLGQQSMF
jgi:hypothetical protein